ncbi:nuclear transport factor 2 family protein [[Mycobacterium] nativiensis]|uniref:Nuclear transport factor 2 family protein n=1 Tax=[Mycobacterium] nativiensis TaxID=2855503 RepID=A0ABU5XYG3_9MYCO|nr:nuclear transport factor 2 family protein [Mycolicibacter sp. MYC340]MEB3033049.1 nuclear transport factor 2 family protein [Mycolicibacter sp. MYC340]
MATPFDDPQAELAWMFLQGICGDDDLDETFALVSDDFTYWSILTGQALDKDALRRQTEDRRRGLRVSLDLLRCINEHETVVIEAQGECVTTDGGHYESPLLFIVDCHDGRIVSVREYTDTRFAGEVLGL